MADFRLGRLKFNWKGNWTTSTAFVIDDIVKYGANAYVCTTNHTSASNENLFYSSDLSKLCCVCRATPMVKLLKCF